MLSVSSEGKIEAQDAARDKGEMEEEGEEGEDRKGEGPFSSSFATAKPSNARHIRTAVGEVVVKDSRLVEVNVVPVEVEGCGDSIPWQKHRQSMEDRAECHHGGHPG